MRNFNAGRSAVYSEQGMVATAHPRATLAALDMLRAGGNAVDAALTASAMLCVVEPQSTGIGGDCFVLYSPKAAGEPIGLNGSGRSPGAATLEKYKALGIDRIAAEMPHAVTVPGAIAAWCRLLEDHGSRSMAEILAPAIQAAEEGYIVTPRVAHDWGKSIAKLSHDPCAAKRFLPDGRPPRLGEKHRQPELAATLKRIAKYGAKGFYEGPVAEDIVSHLKELGGLHSLEDFAEQDCEYVKPVSTRYKGHDVYEIPPNGQGLTALVMLNVLSGYDLAGDRYDEADRIHLLAEAAKSAYLRRDQLFADQRQVSVPVERLLSTAEADRIRSHIDLARARPALPWNDIEHKDTTYLAVVDRDRNAISFINSLFAGFGSGIFAPKSGVMLQNRGMSFRIVDGHPNAIAPRKRPMHTIIPGMLSKDGKAVMPFGVMGGHYQSIGHTMLVSHILDGDLDPQEAINQPRSFAYEGELKLETPIAESVAADLAERGHKVTRLEVPVGGAQAVWIDHARGQLIGASESRKDGCAFGY